MFLWRKDKALEYFNTSDLDDIYNAVEKIQITLYKNTTIY